MRIDGLSDHAIGLVFAIYLVLADTWLVRRARWPGETDIAALHIQEVAHDWGFRIAGLGVLVELLYSFRGGGTTLKVAGFSLSLAGLVAWIVMSPTPVGQLFTRMVGESGRGWRPSYGWILRILLWAALALLIADALGL